VPRQESPAEKALHELDIYKTPLVPTRLRSSNLPASNTANSSSVDLFKSRRGAHLVLMQDDKRINRLGRKVSGKREALLVNETKPYAGEGGMKKLLARRKMEVEDDEEHKEPKVIEVEQRAGYDEDAMEDGEKKVNHEFNRTESIPLPLPPPSKSDWFSMASSSSTAMPSSSLRVGRTKRAHIARPSARPMKTKFSAAYDDDDIMDDGEGDQEEERRKEREMLDEAARRAPVFEIPKDFTFAKVVSIYSFPFDITWFFGQTETVEHDSRDAKEPPIVALPFSFSKPAPTPQIVQPPEQTSNAFLFGTPTPNVTQPRPVAPEFVMSPKLPVATPAFSLPTSDPVPLEAGSNGVPNFFATSSAFTEPLDVPQPPSSTFPVSRSPAVTQSEPLKDAGNPLWEGEGEKKKTETPDLGPNLLSGFGATKDETAPPKTLFRATAPSLFVPPSATSTSTEKTPITSTPSSFGAEMKKDDAPPAVQESHFASPPAHSFSFSQPSSTPTSIFGADISKPASLFGAGSTTPSVNVETPKPMGLFGNETPKTAPPIAFSFSQPAASTAPTVEIPKSFFGGAASAGAVEPYKTNFGGGGFSFSTKDKDSKPVATPFSFGALPSTPPPIEPKKDSPFSFGASPAATSAPVVSVPAPAPITFSFSGGSNASDTASKSFSFGTPAVMAPTDRPSTPPKNQDQEFSMEESPTREVQQVNGTNKPSERPTLGFSFNSNVPGSIFGNQSNGPAPISTPFSFNASSASSNPFAKDNQPDENKPFGGFGQTPTVSSGGSGFTFGQPKAVDNGDSIQRSTSTSFGFSGSAPPSATGSGSTFAFGGPSNNSTGSMFGQANQPSGSAPGSPSTFNQPSPFSFSTAPLPSVNTAFTFGSQPASPAGGNTTLSLPQPATPGGFSSGGGFGQPQPSSPFGAPAPSAPATSGGTLFTIGAAPSTPAPAGARTIRKLPNRRGGAKRWIFQTISLVF
jgi:nucleoporin NUP1